MKASNKGFLAIDTKARLSQNPDVRRMNMKALLKYIPFAALALTLLFSGCGTISTLTEGGKTMNPTFIYSGVRADAGMLCVGGEWAPPWWQKVLLVVDLPLSLCADTICLPYTIYRAVTEPRKIAVWFLAEHDGGPGFIIDSGIQPEQRRIVPANEICAVLKGIRGAPHSVEVVMSDQIGMTVKDVGAFYEVIMANPTLKLCYTPRRSDLLSEYLTMKDIERQPEP